MKSLLKLSLIVLSVCLFTACSQETKQELKEAADAVTAESKEQLSEIADKAKSQVAVTAEVVKSKTQEIVDKASEEVAEERFCRNSENFFRIAQHFFEKSVIFGGLYLAI